MGRCRWAACEAQAAGSCVQACWLVHRAVPQAACVSRPCSAQAWRLWQLDRRTAPLQVCLLHCFHV